MSGEAKGIILAGVAFYMIAMLVIGLLAARRSKNATDFIVAGRNLPLWLCTATVIATWVGGGTVIGAAGAAYGGGLLAVVADPFGATVGIFLVGLLVIRIVRRLRLLTVIDFMEQRYGKGVALISAFAVAGSSVAWTGALMVAFGYVLNSLTGLPLEVGIIAGGSIVLIYTAVGGMWAVAMTDMFQLVVIVLGLVALLIVVVMHLGGLERAWSGIETGSLRLIPYENDAGTWLNYLRAWFIIGVANLSSQALLGRGMAAKSEEVAQKSFYLAGAGYLVIGMIPVILGILARQALPGVDDAESVIPALAMEYLHPVLMALFVGALLAAIMSSADSALLSGASIISVNIIPAFRRHSTPEQQLQWMRIVIPVAGVVAGGIALKVKAVYSLILMANVLQLAMVTGPFLIALWWTKANVRGGQAGVITGLLTWALIELISPQLPGDLLGLCASMLATVWVSLQTQHRCAPRPLVDSDGNPVSTEGLPVIR